MNFGAEPESYGACHFNPRMRKESADKLSQEEVILVRILRQIAKEIMLGHAVVSAAPMDTDCEAEQMAMFILIMVESEEAKLKYVVCLYHARLRQPRLCVACGGPLSMTLESTIGLTTTGFFPAVRQ